MEHITGLRCVICSKVYSYGEVEYTCPACGIEGILDIEYDYDWVAARLTREALGRRPQNHWRYRELLPLKPESELPHLQVGWTPVYHTPRLAEAIGIKDLWVKDDGRNPTASFKDRASSVGVVRAREVGSTTIAAASTGNAASSLAGFAAATGLKSYIFIPERAPEPKVAQLLIFGAIVIKVSGSYDTTYNFCQEACDRWGWYNRNCAINPYLIEGKKTAGLEIAEQLGDRIPDWVVLSVGDGCTIAGVWKGLKEMHRLGFISRSPRILGVQAEGARPVYDSFQTGQDLVVVETNTLADSIAVGHPRNWRKAVRAVRESGGTMVTVPDEQILDAMRVTARLGAVFAEPAAAAAGAGVRAAVAGGIVGRNESALVLVTGNGLKDIRSALQAVGRPIEVPPHMEALEKALEGIDDKILA